MLIGIKITLLPLINIRTRKGKLYYEKGYDFDPMLLCDKYWCC